MNHLSPEQLELLKTQLLKERKAILHELLDEEDTLNFSSTYVEDNAEQAFDNLDKDIISKISYRQKETLKKIDKALKRIDDGSYGICEKSGSPISFKRLEILPYTTVCADFKE